MRPVFMCHFAIIFWIFQKQFLRLGQGKVIDLSFNRRLMILKTHLYIFLQRPIGQTMRITAVLSEPCLDESARQMVLLEQFF
jgi:hypothetical protein